MKTLVAVAILAMVIVPPALAKAKRVQSARPQQGYQSSERPGYYHGYPVEFAHVASRLKSRPAGCGRCSAASNRLIPAPAALETASPQFAAGVDGRPLRASQRCSTSDGCAARAASG